MSGFSFERVLLLVTDEHLVDIRIDRSRGPAGKRTRLDGQKLLGRVDSDNPGDQSRFKGGETAGAPGTCHLRP